MSSQEDYLDSLLRDFTKTMEEGQKNNDEGEFSDDINTEKGTVNAINNLFTDNSNSNLNVTETLGNTNVASENLNTVKDTDIDRKSLNIEETQNIDEESLSVGNSENIDENILNIDSDQALFDKTSPLDDFKEIDDELGEDVPSDVEIEKMISEAKKAANNEKKSRAKNDIDLMDMLKENNDQSLQDIGDILTKSDNNIALGNFLDKADEDMYGFDPLDDVSEDSSFKNNQSLKNNKLNKEKKTNKESGFNFKNIFGKRKKAPSKNQLDNNTGRYNENETLDNHNLYSEETLDNKNFQNEEDISEKNNMINGKKSQTDTENLEYKNEKSLDGKSLDGKSLDGKSLDGKDLDEKKSKLFNFLKPLANRKAPQKELKGKGLQNKAVSTDGEDMSDIDNLLNSLESNDLNKSAKKNNDNFEKIVNVNDSNKNNMDNTSKSVNDEATSFDDVLSNIETLENSAGDEVVDLEGLISGGKNIDIQKNQGDVTSLEEETLENGFQNNQAVTMEKQLGEPKEDMLNDLKPLEDEDIHMPEGIEDEKTIEAKNIGDSIDDIKNIGDSIDDIKNIDENIDGIKNLDESIDGIKNIDESIDGIKNLDENIDDIKNLDDSLMENLDSIENLDALGDVENIDANSESAGDEQKNSKKDKNKDKKKGLIARIFDALTEEVEEEDDKEALKLSDENKEILDELSDDDGKGKKKKKGKKDKKDKKGKKNKGDDSENELDERGDGEEEGNDKKKGKKPKKVKKPKKEKAPKNLDATKDKNKLSIKKMLPIFAVGITILIFLIIVTKLTGNFIVKKQAHAAFYRQDYETCYQDLFGQDLNETEEIMFGKSESILRIRMWLKEYEMFEDNNEEEKALDSLIQSINEYSDLYEYALKWNAEGDIAVIYAQFLDILKNKYGLDEQQALEIAGTSSDVDYSRMIYTIVDGGKYGDWDTLVEDAINGAETITTVSDSDILPEEGEAGDFEFIQNE